MPITQTQWETTISEDLIKKYFDDLIWGDIISALQNAGAGDRNQLIVALKQSQDARAGKVVKKLLQDEFRTRAGDEAATILADGFMTVAEHNRWKGDG